MKSETSEIIKEVGVVCLTFTAFISVAATRGFVAFQLPQLKATDSDILISDEEASWIATLTILPNPIGCILGGLLMDWIGRKITLQSIFLPFTIAWTIIGFSNSVEMLYVGTFFSGVAAGACYCSSVYIAEICSPEHRGPLLGFLEPTYTFGILTCNLLVHNFGWRTTAYYFICGSVISFILLFLLPESPTWLVTRGKTKKAMEILKWLRRDRSEAEREISEIESSLKLNTKNNFCSTVFTDVLTSWKPLAILIGLNVLQRLCGCPVLESYTVMFFDSLQLPFDSSTAALYHSTTNFITSFFTPFAIQKLPRRVLLGITSFIMSLSMIVVIIYETQYFGSTMQPYFWVVLVSVYTYDVASTLGVLPLPFILSGELFPAENRGRMNGIYGCFSFLISATVVKMFPAVLHICGIINVVLSYAIVCIVTILYGKYIVPETRGKTLPEIQIKYFKRQGEHYVESLHIENSI